MTPVKRVHNFNAGPSVLPLSVLEKAQAEMLDYQGCGMSVMEMSHRSKEFESIIQTAEADLRGLLSIPAHYKVMFLQGGASLQFAMLPMNLRPAGSSADYIVTGSWSRTQHRFQWGSQQLQPPAGRWRVPFQSPGGLCALLP
jgi:phosphoserine aminotransferase